MGLDHFSSYTANHFFDLDEFFVLDNHCLLVSNDFIVKIYLDISRLAYFSRGHVDEGLLFAVNLGGSVRLVWPCLASPRLGRSKVMETFN